MDELNKAHAIAFGRWILKHAETSMDEEGMFCYKYINELLSTLELYEIFMIETYLNT